MVWVASHMTWESHDRSWEGWGGPVTWPLGHVSSHPNHQQRMCDMAETSGYVSSLDSDYLRDKFIYTLKRPCCLWDVWCTSKMAVLSARYLVCNQNGRVTFDNDKSVWCTAEMARLRVGCRWCCMSVSIYKYLHTCVSTLSTAAAAAAAASDDSRLQNGRMYKRWWWYLDIGRWIGMFGWRYAERRMRTGSASECRMAVRGSGNTQHAGIAPQPRMAT